MITCNRCKAKFDIPEGSDSMAKELSCPQCHSRLRVRWKMEVEEEAEEPMNVQPSGLKILVAVDGEATQEVMREVLTAEGHEVLLASTGKEALSILEKEHPKIAYLDVALPQVLGFEVCEIIKRSSQLKATKVILVSAIYDKTRYKRAPSSLYGADDYIERHHIQDGLIPKLKKMLNEDETSSQMPGSSSSSSSVEVLDKESLSPRNGVSEAGPSKKVQIFSIPDPGAKPVPAEAPPVVQETSTGETLPGEVEGLPEASPAVQEVSIEQPLSGEETALPGPGIGTELKISVGQSPFQETAPAISPEEAGKHEEAKRLARLIISDIALYNQQTIEEGIENGNVEEILKDEMAEAEKLFCERISKEVREKTPYLQNALRDFVERKMKLMKEKR